MLQHFTANAPYSRSNKFKNIGSFLSVTCFNVTGWKVTCLSLLELSITCSFWSGQEQAPFVLQWQQKFEQKTVECQEKISFKKGLPFETFKKTRNSPLRSSNQELFALYNVPLKSSGGVQELVWHHPDQCCFSVDNESLPIETAK